MTGTGRPIPSYATDRYAWLAPMVLWPLARRHLPRPAVRPQGGGTQRADDEAMFAAIVYVLVSGDSWRALPRTFAVSWQNTHRRFVEWSDTGLWDRVRYASLNPQIPPQTRQWAETMVTLVERRRMEGRRAQQAAAAAGRATPVRPRTAQNALVRAHRQDDLADRRYGAPYGAGRRPGPAA